jgi:hypothetical protein
MKAIRISLATLVFAIALIALDLALVRYLFGFGRPLMVSVRNGLLMANALPIAAYQLWVRRGQTHSFLTGFVAAGLAAALLCQACCWMLAPKAMDDYQARLVAPVAFAIHGVLPQFESLGNGRFYYRILFYFATIPAIAAVVGLPQLLAALSGGLYWWKVQRRIESERQGDNPSASSGSPSCVGEASGMRPMRSTTRRGL